MCGQDFAFLSDPGGYADADSDADGLSVDVNVCACSSG